VTLAFCVVYGLLFMVLMIYNYEEFLHHDNYTRYVMSQAKSLLNRRYMYARPVYARYLLRSGRLKID
jgi:hypothetical protein